MPVAITKYPAQMVFTNKVVDAVVGAKYNLHCENDWILMGDSPDTFSCAGTFYRIYFTLTCFSNSFAQAIIEAVPLLFPSQKQMT